MSRQTTSSTPQADNFQLKWLEHPWVEWLVENRWSTFGLLVAVFAGLILCYRYVSISNTKAEEDYLRAENEFILYQNSLQDSARQDDALLLVQLEEIMSRHPELHANYDGAIGQTLLLSKGLQEAQPFAQRTFKRTSGDDIKNIHRYSTISLLISKPDYKEALQESLALKTSLDQIPDSSKTVLYGMNLLRIAILNQQLEQTEGEKKSWAEIKNYLSEQPEVIAKIEKTFGVGWPSVAEYMAIRLKS